MSVSDLRPAKATAVALPALLALLLSTETYAQMAPTISDADIERAKRLQPAIGESEIEEARKRHRMPSDTELSRIPAPSTPRVDSLPIPNGIAPIPNQQPALDLEAIAKGYAASRGPTGAMPSLAGPRLLIFVSFSVPQPTLERLVDQAARAGAVLLIRGLINGSLKETVAQIHHLIGQRRVAFQIDPQAFDRFAIDSTPAFVLVRDGTATLPCNSGLCPGRGSFVSTSGDVSLDYALEYIARSAPPYAEAVRMFLVKLKG